MLATKGRRIPSNVMRRDLIWSILCLRIWKHLNQRPCCHLEAIAETYLKSNSPIWLQLWNSIQQQQRNMTPKPVQCVDIQVTQTHQLDLPLHPRTHRRHQRHDTLPRLKSACTILVMIYGLAGWDVFMIWPVWLKNTKVRGVFRVMNSVAFLPKAPAMNYKPMMNRWS